MSAEFSDAELDLLADVLAGEAAEADVARVHASARLAQGLIEFGRADAAVRSELAALAEVRIEPPAGLDARLRAALAEFDAPRRPRVRQLAAVRVARAARTGEPWLLRAVASVAGLIVLAGIGIAVTQGSSENELDAVASGPQQASPLAAEVPARATGRDYARPGAVAQALPFLLADGNKSGADAALSGGSTDPPAPQFQVPLRLPAAPQFPAAPDRPSSSTGGSSTGSAFGTTGGSTGSFGSPGDAAVPGRVETLSAVTLNRLRNPTARQACFTALGLEPATMPEALDFARYAGQPALMIVLGVPDEPAALTVFVVGPTCGQGTGALLFSGQFDRP